MIFLRENWHIGILILVIVFLYIKLNSLEKKLIEVEGVAYESFAEAQTIMDIDDNASSLDFDTKLSDLEQRLDKHLDCLELWSMGSGFMNKKDVYFCSFN